MESLVSNKPPSANGPDRSKSKPSAATHKALIARNLRTVFGETAAEQVPQHLLDILKPLDGDDQDNKS